MLEEESILLDGLLMETTCAMKILDCEPTSGAKKGVNAYHVSVHVVLFIRPLLTARLLELDGQFYSADIAALRAGSTAGWIFDPRSEIPSPLLPLIDDDGRPPVCHGLGCRMQRTMKDEH
ncbi:hypothetical protein ACLOJK_036412 [Asimina triloba]